MNPHEKTGKSGKGSLWWDGVNYASDALIVVDIAGVKHMVAIKRTSGQWAMPGGFREKKAGLVEDARTAAFRELREETALLFSDFEQSQAECVYEGYSADSRNTDDSWIETAVYWYDMGAADPLPKLIAGDDARYHSGDAGAAYLPMTPENIAALYPPHAKIVAQILAQRGKDFCDGCLHALFQTLASDRGLNHSLLTKFLNQIFRLAMRVDHAHPNYLVRLQMALLLSEDVLKFTRSRVEARLSADEVQMCVKRVQKFNEDHRSFDAPQNIDRALDILPTHFQPEVAVPIVPGSGELN